jgi:segregation and condensation protein B
MTESEQREEDTDSVISELKKNVQAILFSAARAVDIEELSKLTKTASQSMIREAVKELKTDLQSQESPLLLTPEGDNSWKLTVRDKYVSMVKEVTPHTEMEMPMLATLALVAWKQPVLQSEVIKRRSSVAYEHIAKLVELGFISKGKKGRSFVLKPTGKFFDYFDLPDKKAVQELFDKIEPLKVETIVEETVVYKAKSMSGPDGSDPDQEARNQVGALQVYNAPVESEEKTEVQEAAETEETDAKQPADESKEEEEKSAEQAQQEAPAEEEKEEESAPEESSESADFEDEAARKTKAIVDELLTEDKKEEKKEGEQTEETGEGEEDEKHKEGRAEEKEEDKEPPKRKLDPELEEFVGEETKLGDDKKEDL